jgi:hypothetical protein
MKSDETRLTRSCNSLRIGGIIISVVGALLLFAPSAAIARTAASAHSSHLLDDQKAQITDPVMGTVLPSSTVTFLWGPVSNNVSYYLEIGTTQGSADIYGQAVTGGSTTVSGLPMDDRIFYVRLWSSIGGVWQYNEYNYYTGHAFARFKSPANGSTLTGFATFTWTYVFSIYLSNHLLELGSSPGGHDIFSSWRGGYAWTIIGIPTDGRTVYARIWTVDVDGTWYHDDRTYQTADSRPSITSPANGSTLSSTVTFNWGPYTNGSVYFLDLSSSPGSRDIFADYVTGGSTTVSGIPTDGRTIYVRLWAQYSGAWIHNDYVYQGCNGCVVNTSISQITSPSYGSTFASSNATFTWNPVEGASQYYLDLSSSPGSRDIFADYVTGGSTTVSGIPTDGRAISVRLWTNIGGVWQYNEYTYRASTSGLALISSPVNGSTFTSSTVTFTWNTVAGASQYFLDLNTSPGSRDIFANYVTGGSTTVSGIPTDGRTIYVRLWTNIGGVWSFNTYTYTASH